MITDVKLKPPAAMQAADHRGRSQRQHHCAVLKYKRRR